MKYSYLVLYFSAALLSSCGGDNNGNNTPLSYSSLPEASELPSQNLKLWDTKYTPIPLTNPTTIVLPRDITPIVAQAYNASCEGYVYGIKIPKGEDALITFEGDEPLQYPVLISGGNNIHIKGLEIKLEAQNKCLPNTYTYSDGQKNLHPRAPTSRALGISPYNSVTIEGTLIDVNGHDADCIVSNNNAYDGKADLLHKSKVLIQNSACYGIESDGDLHGDVFQTQGGALKELVIENFTARQSAEGIILSYPVAHTTLRNYDYDTDPRFDHDDPEDIYTGAAFWDNSKQIPKMTFSFENVYINYLNPSTTGWFYAAGQHFVTESEAGSIRYGTKTEYHPHVRFRELPPKGDMAPRTKIGRYYNANEKSAE